MKKIKQFWDKFTDDQEFIRLKLGLASEGAVFKRIKYKKDRSIAVETVQ